jgi:hypothetical protein
VLQGTAAHFAWLAVSLPALPWLHHIDLRGAPVFKNQTKPKNPSALVATH